jgi:predicted transcriptional regulator
MLTEREKHVLEIILAFRAAYKQAPTICDVKELVNIEPTEVVSIIRHLVKCGFVDRAGDYLRAVKSGCLFMGYDRRDGKTYFVRTL